MQSDMNLMLILIVIVACFQAGTGQTVITNTSLGQVMGVKLAIPGTADAVITRYAGIPYGEPPTGQLRFAKPEQKSPWDGVFNATVFGKKCPQSSDSFDVFISSQFNQFIPNTDIGEDCLFLNVYVPHDIVAASGPLPVMVYIHGGSLVNGEGALYDGTLLAIQGQVIMVNFNYRLGIFGFLTTGDDSAPGNYGLWDQRLAIQWVKDNIRNFGGDSDQITIFGESAGAWSVTYQMLSPVNDKTLFQRVISQSGVAFPGLIIPGDLAKLEAWRLALSLGCNLPYGSTTRGLISCLRASNTEDLMSKADLITTAATIDGEFLPSDIKSLLSHPRVKQYDLLLGVNSQEGSVFQGADQYTAQELRKALYFQVLLTCRCANPQDIIDALFAFYFGADKLEDRDENLLKYLDLVGDLYFDIPGADFRNRHVQSAANSSTYFYYFTYETGKQFLLRPELVDRIPGAPHILDIFYVFGLINFLLPGNAEVTSLSTTIIRFWSQFARNGNPNSPGLPEWPEFDAENETYIILDNNIRTGQHLKADKVAFWNNYIPTITNPSDERTCSYEVPVRGTTVRQPVNKTVEISSTDGDVLGSVIGALKVADQAMGGQEVAEFLGIPYAKPPLGDLRFRPPQDTRPWGAEPLGIPDKLPPACPQDVTVDPWMVRLGFTQTSEDCLTLNIYAPTKDASDPALPVLVFIHVGYGVSSTSSIYDAVLLASQIKAVVLVINHRLGALGFLSTEDGVAPGNYGLHDVLAALKWVNKYIGSFGGDAERVTVLGHGSGAVLTHLLILSEKAQGLFKRAVLMSATAISPPVDNQVQPRASEKAKALAAAVGCPTSSSEMMINCLREKTVAELISNTKTPPFGLAFPSVIDGDIITDKPGELLKAGRINDVDIIVGLALDENAAPSFFFTGVDCPSTQAVEYFIGKVSSLSFHNPHQASLALVTEYLGKGGLDDDCQARGSFRRLMNDYLSYWSTVEAARIHADAGHSVFFYSFDHKPPAHYVGVLPPQAGPALTDDLQFLFGDPYSPLVDELQLSYRLQDKRYTLELMAFLKNFIYNGEPGSSLSGVKWPAFDSVNLTYMSLTDCPQAYSGHDNNWEQLHRFWATYLPTITTSPSPSTTTPPKATPCPPDQEPCTVGEGIGLTLTPDEASTLIEALIGATIGALILSVFFFGGCMAYRARVKRVEAQGIKGAGKGLPNYLDNAEREEFSSQL